MKPDTLKLMTEPSSASPANHLTFRPWLLTFNARRSTEEYAHGGAVYGFATELECLPDAKLGAIVITSVDLAYPIARHIAETALRLALAVREGRPLPVLETTDPIARRTAQQLEGHYISGDMAINFIERAGKLFLSGGHGAEGSKSWVMRVTRR